MAKQHVTTTLNGNAVEFLCETRQTLLEVLRDDLHLTGTGGLWRALSVICLGVVLIGIGLAYQKLIFGRPPAAPPHN